MFVRFMILVLQKYNLFRLWAFSSVIFVLRFIKIWDILMCIKLLSEQSE